MSDRIDELVRKSLREVALLAHPQKGDPSPKMLERESIRLITELAAIAREVEAHVAVWIDRCYQWEKRALKAEAMCEWLAEEVAMGRHDTVDNVLDAAREAVIHTANS